MTYYMDTIAFAYNRPGETVFWCISCAKDEYGDSPHTTEGVMMVNEHTEISFIRCDSCGDIIRND